MSTMETPYYYADKSFRYLFDRFKNQLYGFVLGIGQQPYTAEEITLDVFFEIWLRREILHEVSDLDEHVFTIAVNRMFQQEALELEHGEELTMRSLWDGLKIQPVEYPVDWERAYRRMNQKEEEVDVREERRARILVRIAIVFFLLMAAVAAYLSIKW